MPKFFVEPSKVTGDTITIDTSDVLHITKVLRLNTGDIVTVSDSKSTDYECEITEISKESVFLKVLSQKNIDTESNIQITVFQALPKASKMEYIIQKNTELGVVKFVPVALSRCVVKLDKKEADKKVSRWQKISDEAAKQSGRGILPEVSEIVNLKTAIEKMKQSDLFFVPYESEDNNSLKPLLKGKTPKTISYLIGPEGGFSPEEIICIKEEGIPLITLGKRILRTETASLAVTSMLMYEIGDMG